MPSLSGACLSEGGLEFTPVPLHPVVTPHRDKIEGVLWPVRFAQEEEGQLRAVGGQRKPEPRNSYRVQRPSMKTSGQSGGLGTVMPTSQKSGEEWRKCKVFSL